MSLETQEAAELKDFIPVVKKEGATHQEPWCYGAPVGWIPPCAPDDWKPNEPKPQKGEPESFDNVDNPGGWSTYSYQAAFEQKKGKKYVQHQLPTGVVPVPLDEDGKRTCNGWEFHYKGWSLPPDVPKFRDEATKEDMFPQFRRGSLDQNILSRLGLTKERMADVNNDPNALWFYQLLLPIHHINQAKKIEPVEDDPRSPFYCEVSKFTNLYAVGELELGCGYGHHFETTSAAELLHWDGVLVMDGVRGGSRGAILRRFDNYNGSKSYDPDISKAMTKSRWLEIKRTIKLCNNLTAKKRGEDGYNPAYKHDMTFKTIVHNVNAISLYANPDQCGDETSYGFQGWGEPASGLVYLINNKPEITKGMQTVITSDVDWIRPRAYIHRHKKHPKLFTNQGPTEVRLMWETQLLPLCRPDNTLIGKALFQTKPHITWDNFFSGTEIMEYAAQEGFGLTMTCRRDRLPAGVPRKYFHHKKTPVTHRTRAARFEHPIVAVKQIAQSWMTMISFQSTSSCNFASVNAINSVSLFAHTKQRGREDRRKQWAIEMNEGRDLYLRTHGVIDRMDHLIKNCCMKYRTWKCWHKAMIHAKAMAVVIAYDMYLECCVGALNADWKQKPVCFYRFRERLAKQMLTYNPTDRLYAGDEKLRACTQQKKCKRSLSAATPLSASFSTPQYKTSTGVDPSKLDQVKGRLCGFLDDLLLHEQSIVPLKKKAHQVCRCCGKHAYYICQACPDKPALHIKRGGDKRNSCFLNYHNTASFGLWRDDCVTTGSKRRKDWQYPKPEELESSSKEMKRLHLALFKSPSTNNSSSSATSSAAADNLHSLVTVDKTWNEHCL